MNNKIVSATRNPMRGRSIKVQVRSLILLIFSSEIQFIVWDPIIRITMFCSLSVNTFKAILPIFHSEMGENNLCFWQNKNENLLPSISKNRDCSQIYLLLSQIVWEKHIYSIGAETKRPKLKFHMLVWVWY